MATAFGITLIKKFTYRDDSEEEWSNKYWFTGTPPNSQAEYEVAFDTLAAREKTCYAPTSHIVRAYGYNDSDPSANAAATKDYELLGATIPGTLVADAGSHVFAGDQAGVMWALTSRKNSRGKWIYLRKYFHDGFIGADRDKISTNTLNAYNAFGTELRNGTWLSGRVWRSAKQDETLQENSHDPWVTTRTLKRRGKRP